MFSVTAFAADIVASGYCGGEGDGTNLSWSLTDEALQQWTGRERLTGELIDRFIFSTCKYLSRRSGKGLRVHKEKGICDSGGCARGML